MIGKWKRGRLYYVVFLSVLISLCLLSPARAQMRPEVEPNDNRDQAQEIRVDDTVAIT